MHLTNKTENTLIDEFTAIVALLLTASSVFSFISIRIDNTKKEMQLEKIADYLFIISLIAIFGIIAFIIINFSNK